MNTDTAIITKNQNGRFFFVANGRSSNGEWATAAYVKRVAIKNGFKVAAE